MAKLIGTLVFVVLIAIAVGGGIVFDSEQKPTSGKPSDIAIEAHSWKSMVKRRAFREARMPRWPGPCPPVASVLPRETNDRGDIEVLVMSYLDMQRMRRPYIEGMWRWTDRWRKEREGWSDLSDFTESAEGEGVTTDDIFFNFKLEWVRALTREALVFQMTRAGVPQEVCREQLDVLADATWWVGVGHPDCHCASRGLVDILVVRRKGVGLRIFSIS